MDATGSVRAYLKRTLIHDFESQKQGQEYKQQVPTFLMLANELAPSTASLYRPNTKNGDPRIWFKGLGYYAKANDILAVISHEKKLYVVNITQLDLAVLLTLSHLNPIKELFNEISRFSNAIADELLMKLRAITAKGFTPALLEADTAVGKTLETLLGIKSNSSKKPDYKGIEFKAFRDKRGNRKNLFAQVPDWDLSVFRSSSDILNAFGYHRGDDFKLYCTVSSKVKNSQGLSLRTDMIIQQLIESSDKKDIGDFVVWRLELLHKRLIEKHSETFWIAADSIFIDGKEHFQYKKAEHTKKPILSQFDILLDQGIITLDHLIKKTPSGGVVEKGPIFKIKPNGLGLLFPPSVTHSLMHE
jgi:hypothetical protein